jgi:hypothetical protein
MSGPIDISPEDERVQILLQQGYTPNLAKNIVMARSQENLPLTIWIVDNSSSMNMKDGRKLLSTADRDDVRVTPCTRWEELKETVMYHAQMARPLESAYKIYSAKSRQSVSERAATVSSGNEYCREGR